MINFDENSNPRFTRFLRNYTDLEPRKISPPQDSKLKGNNLNSHTSLSWNKLRDVLQKNRRLTSSLELNLEKIRTIAIEVCENEDFIDETALNLFGVIYDNDRPLKAVKSTLRELYNKITMNQVKQLNMVMALIKKELDDTCTNIFSQYFNNWCYNKSKDKNDNQPGNLTQDKSWKAPDTSFLENLSGSNQSFADSFSMLHTGSVVAKQQLTHIDAISLIIGKLQSMTSKKLKNQNECNKLTPEIIHLLMSPDDNNKVKSELIRLLGNEDPQLINWLVQFRKKIEMDKNIVSGKYVVKKGIPGAAATSNIPNGENNSPSKQNLNVLGKGKKSGNTEVNKPGKKGLPETNSSTQNAKKLGMPRKLEENSDMEIVIVKGGAIKKTKPISLENKFSALDIISKGKNEEKGKQASQPQNQNEKGNKNQPKKKKKKNNLTENPPQPTPMQQSAPKLRIPPVLKEVTITPVQRAPNPEEMLRKHVETTQIPVETSRVGVSPVSTSGLPTQPFHPFYRNSMLAGVDPALLDGLKCIEERQNAHISYCMNLAATLINLGNEQSAEILKNKINAVVLSHLCSNQ